MANEKGNPDNRPPESVPPINRKSMRSGLITLGAVGENDLPETAVRESVNFHFDAIGQATVRKGMTRLGNQMATSAVLGLYYFVDTVNTVSNSRLLAVNGSSVFYLNSATWTSLRTGLTAGSKARFTTFLNYTFMVNGTEATTVFDGVIANGFVATGNASGAPTGKFVENFKGRVWIFGGTKPSRVHYSSIPSATATPTITWNTSDTTGQWLDISPQDGDFPTGLQRFRNVLLCFKTNRIYRVFDVGQTDPDPYYAVGTSSQESIIETKTGVFFHHSSGFYQYNIYGVVQEISRPVIDFIRAIPVSAYTSVTGWLEPDGDHIVWAIGTVTVRGTTYTNCELRYTISTQTWTQYSRKNHQMVTSIRRQPFYDDNTTQFALCGDTIGNVYKMDTGLTDGGDPIYYSLVHRWDYIDGLLSLRNNIMIVNFVHIGGTGSNVSYQTEANDPDALNDWSKGFGNSPSQLETINTGFNSANIKARKMRFRIWGQSTGQPFFYNGYELIDVQSEFIQFQ